MKLIHGFLPVVTDLHKWHWMLLPFCHRSMRSCVMSLSWIANHKIKAWLGMFSLNQTTFHHGTVELAVLRSFHAWERVNTALWPSWSRHWVPSALLSWRLGMPWRWILGYLWSHVQRHPDPIMLLKSCSVMFLPIPWLFLSPFGIIFIRGLLHANYQTRSWYFFHPLVCAICASIFCLEERACATKMFLLDPCFQPPKRCVSGDGVF